MGNICQFCDRFSLIEDEKENSKKNENQISDISLPKENISEYSKEEDIEEKKNLKFEKDDTDKVKDKDKDKEKEKIQKLRRIILIFQRKKNRKKKKRNIQNQNQI